jgi:hypothetical protein
MGAARCTGTMSMCREIEKIYLLILYPFQAPIMWSIVAAMGVISFAGVFLYDRLLMAHK